MKAYTDIPQSKKLAKILPLESADAAIIGKDNIIVTPYDVTIKSQLRGFVKEYDIIPCWSLAALFGVLPSKCYPIKDHETNLILGKPKDKWCALYWDTTGMQHGEQTLADNPVDACYEMIIRLNELKML